MKHFEVLRKWCKNIEIEIFDKWLISLDRVTYYFLSWCCFIGFGKRYPIKNVINKVSCFLNLHNKKTKLVGNRCKLIKEKEIVFKHFLITNRIIIIIKSYVTNVDIRRKKYCYQRHYYKCIKLLRMLLSLWKYYCTCTYISIKDLQR